jgi:hypothetical protein
MWKTKFCSNLPSKEHKGKRWMTLPASHADKVLDVASIVHGSVKLDDHG